MKILNNKILFLLLFIIISSLSITGCFHNEQKFDPSIRGPQLIVTPQTIRLGVATLTKTPIIFKGKGFKPNDSVFIKLLDVNTGDKTIDIPIADAVVDSKGSFLAKVGTLAKVNDILRAKLGSNEKLENIIIVTGPPIPEGTYTAKAISMESDITAECKITFKNPSIIDKIKDLIGRILGKIVIKK